MSLCNHIPLANLYISGDVMRTLGIVRRTLHYPRTTCLCSAIRAAAGPRIKCQDVQLLPTSAYLACKYAVEILVLSSTIARFDVVLGKTKTLNLKISSEHGNADL